MVNFKFDTDLTKMALNYGIQYNPNQTVTTGEGAQTSTTDSGEGAKAAVESQSMDQQNQAITINFDCYNVVTFDRNSINSPISFRVYNEHGEAHLVSGTAIVRSCSYELSGAVIKASIEATQQFNKIVADVDDSQRDSLNTGVPQDSQNNEDNTQVSGNAH